MGDDEPEDETPCECPSCGGEGEWEDYRCRACNGTGAGSEPRCLVSLEDLEEIPLPCP